MKRTIFIITAWLLYSFAFAQQGEILYFDLEPDSTRTFHNGTPPRPSIRLDVDRDGLCEWKINRQDGGHQSITFWMEPNVHPFVDSLGWYQHLRLSSKGHIGDTLPNLEYGTVPRYEIIELGDYPNQMLALRYQVDEGYCYGWIRFSARLYDPAPIYGATMLDVAVHEMAYCTIPNYPLLLGQTCLEDGVDENTAFVTLHPNPTTGLVQIKGQNLKQAEVINTLGQQVASMQGKGNEMIVDIAHLPAGVYFVRITDEKGRKCVRKVVKE